MNAVRVRIIHQVDPDGSAPGGIITFIRGLIKAAPTDIAISVVGLTTDPVQRPVRRWSVLERSGRAIPFSAVGRDHTPGRRGRIPLSVRMTAGLTRHRRARSAGCDILAFHRFESMLPFLRDRRPVTAFVHANMNVLRIAHSDIMWKHAPAVNFALERRGRSAARERILCPRGRGGCVSRFVSNDCRKADEPRAGAFRATALWAKQASVRCDDGLRRTYRWYVNQDADATR